MKLIKNFLMVAVVVFLLIMVYEVNIYYYRVGVVLDYNKQTNICTIADISGHKWEWQFENDCSKDFSIGTNVKLKMNNNLTEDDITDDVIVKIIKGR